jgi:hypothetical protein
MNAIEIRPINMRDDGSEFILPQFCAVDVPSFQVALKEVTEKHQGTLFDLVQEDGILERAVFHIPAFRAWAFDSLEVDDAFDGMDFENQIMLTTELPKDMIELRGVDVSRTVSIWRDGTIQLSIQHKHGAEGFIEVVTA